MPSNIEIKARVHDMARLREIAESLADAPGIVLEQEDVFFPSETGRLKLRILSNSSPSGGVASNPSGELIYYTRPDAPNAKLSYYCIFRTAEPTQLRRVLGEALGESIVVKKKRLLFLVGQTRIHLDTVEGLGTFMELEVVLRPDQAPGEGREIAKDLMKKLDIHESDLISGAYADLIRQMKK